MRHEKLSPGILLAYEDYQREGGQGLTTHKRSLGIVAPRSALKPIRSVVFIYCDEQADLSHLSQYGIKINQNTGKVRTAFLPIEALDRLSEEPAIERIKPSRKLYWRMDVASQKVELPQFQKKNSKLNGKGVVIGVRQRHRYRTSCFRRTYFTSSGIKPYQVKELQKVVTVPNEKTNI